MLHAPNIAGEGDAPSPIRMHAISLGAGVQSTALALMLDRVDLSTAADHGRLDLWPNECEGMCGG